MNIPPVGGQESPQHSAAAAKGTQIAQSLLDPKPEVLEAPQEIILQKLSQPAGGLLVPEFSAKLAGLAVIRAAQNALEALGE